MSTPAPRLVSDVEAAQVLGFRPQTLRNMRTQNRGPRYVKINRTVRYDLADLAFFIEAHRVQPAGEPQGGDA